LNKLFEVTGIFQVAVCKILFYDRINSISLEPYIHPLKKDYSIMAGLMPFI